MSTSTEYILVAAILFMGIIGSAALYERHLVHQDLIQQEMRGAL